MRYSILFEVYEGANTPETLTEESVVIHKIWVNGVNKKSVKIGDRIYKEGDETTTLVLDELYEKEIAGHSFWDIIDVIEGLV